MAELERRHADFAHALGRQEGVELKRQPAMKSIAGVIQVGDRFGIANWPGGRRLTKRSKSFDRHDPG